MLDYRIRIMQNRDNSVIRGFAYAVGLGLSMLGFAIFLANYSFIASILFPISIFGWLYLAIVVTYGGYRKDSQV
jgi:pilus assembly protein TadC